MTAFFFLLDQLFNRWGIFVVACPHGLQAGAKDAWVTQQHSVLYVAILQDVQDVVDNSGQYGFVHRVCFLVIPQVCLRHMLRGVPERRRLRKPFARLQKNVI